MSISRAKRYSKKRRRSQTNITGSKSKFKRGFYKPVNETYQQPMDRTMNKSIYPEYRSSYELKFYSWCDKNPDIVQWAVEPFFISYISPKDGQPHRYFPDVMIKFKDGKRYLIEIKPSLLVEDAVVQAKAKAAINFCNENGMEFRFITEKDLGIK